MERATVFMVSLNAVQRNGHPRHEPECVGIVTSARTAHEAVEWTLINKDVYAIRDITVEVLYQGHGPFWFQEGPELPA